MQQLEGDRSCRFLLDNDKVLIVLPVQTPEVHLLVAQRNAATLDQRGKWSFSGPARGIHGE